MSPNCLQIATTSALLLATVYLSLGAHIPTRRAATGATVHPATLQAIKRRTGSEAINAKAQVDDYFKDAYDNKHLNVTAECSALVARIDLPCPQDVSGCNTMVNASTNLHHLLYMYSHLLGLVYQNNTNETLMEQLDLLEMMYCWLSHQMQRYLQAQHNLTSGNTNSIEHQEMMGSLIQRWWGNSPTLILAECSFVTLETLQLPQCIQLDPTIVNYVPTSFATVWSI